VPALQLRLIDLVAFQTAHVLQSSHSDQNETGHGSGPGCFPTP
jgi:hypothetical protein